MCQRNVSIPRLFSIKRVRGFEHEIRRNGFLDFLSSVSIGTPLISVHFVVRLALETEAWLQPCGDGVPGLNYSLQCGWGIYSHAGAPVSEDLGSEPSVIPSRRFYSSQ